MTDPDAAAHVAVDLTRGAAQMTHRPETSPAFAMYTAVDAVAALYADDQIGADLLLRAHGQAITHALAALATMILNRAPRPGIELLDEIRADIPALEAAWRPESRLVIRTGEPEADEA